MMFKRLFRYSAILFACAAAYPIAQASAEPVSHAAPDEDLDDGAQILVGMLVIGGIGLAAGNSHKRWKPPEASRASFEEPDDSGEN